MTRAFPLQSVLEHRVRIEEGHQQTLARHEALLEQAQAAVAELEASRDALIAQLNDVRAAPALDPYALVVGAARLARAEAAIADARGTVESLTAEVAAARAIAIAASQDRITIERLRDQFIGEEHTRAERVEAERIGELGLSRWVRQNDGGSGG